MPSKQTKMLPLLIIVSSLGFASAAHKISHPALHARQASAAPLCRLNYTTDVWTGCDDVLAQFQIPLDGFITANPGLGPACTGFVPGKTYCVSWRKCNHTKCFKSSFKLAKPLPCRESDSKTHQQRWTMWQADELQCNVCRKHLWRLL